MRVSYLLGSSLTACASAIALASPALSADVAASAVQAGTPISSIEQDQGLGDIVVTARKRVETSIAVPVVLTAIGGAEMERRAINSLDVIARSIPNLIVGEGGGTAQGGNIAIRGIQGADGNNLGDQAVAFNIDGVQVARATVRRLSQMDMAQVEVLKGPQALFFGKNSPAGIISVRTADPTRSLEAGLNAGYEFNAQEVRVDGYISSPLTDALGARLAFYGSDMRGWVESTVPSTSALAPPHRHVPRERELAGRLTLKFEPSDQFNARLKVSHADLKGSAAGANFQLINCPLGRPQPFAANVVDDCTPNDKNSVGVTGTSFNAIDPRLPVKNFLNQNQTLASVEMNYMPTPDLTITSVSSLYKTHMRANNNFSATYEPTTIVAVLFGVDVRELTEEIRLNSSFDGPVNFTIGGLYQDVRGSTINISYFNANAPAPLTGYFYRQRGRTYSAFGQLRWDVLPTLEFAAGGRYSKETKRLPEARLGVALVPAVPSEDKVSFNDFSPEVTLTWRPTQRLTVFGGYKRGFLSGGFNTGAANVGPGLSYDQEVVKGFEGGVKALLLDGTLRTNLSFFSYEVQGLQVAVTVQNALSQLRNAGTARVKGSEFDFTYRTPIEGLSVRGALGYTHARYSQYIAACYRGQPLPDCALRFNPTSGLLSLSQDLKGGQLVRAPDWTGNAGFNYETPIGSGLKLGLSGDVSFSSGFFTDASNKPAGRMPSYELFDGSVQIGDRDDQWKVALIGRNLTNKYYWVRNSDRPFTGNGPGLPAADSVLADTAAPISRGREIFVRLSVKWGG